MGLLATALLLSLAPAPLPQEVDREPEVRCTLSEDSIYLGQSSIYLVEITNVPQPTAPTLAGLEGLQVEYLDEVNGSSSQTLIVNGKVTRYERLSHTYYYRLKPEKAGRFKLPGPAVEVAGVTVRGNAVELEALKPEEQEFVSLEVFSDHDSVYPMQSFTVTLEILVRELPPTLNRAQQDPLTPLRENPPELTLPWLRPPDGLETEGLNAWISGVAAGNGVGFVIAGPDRQRLTSLFHRDLVLSLPSDWVSKPLAEGGSGRFRRYRLARTFTPLIEGRFSFGPALVEGLFGTRERSGRLEGDHIFVSSNTCTVEVKPAPLDDRPADFTGGIGDFRVEGRLNPSQARIGDPMTFRLIVSGTGTLEDIRPPDLEAVSGVSEVFKVYDATAETQVGGKQRIFTYSLRPLKANTEVFPAIPFTFFDVNTESFRTVKTDPIPVEIAEAERVGEDSIVSNGGARSRKVEAAMVGYAPNDESLEGLMDRELPLGALGTWLGSMAAAWGAAWFLVTRARRLRADPAIRMRREAAGVALQRLEEAGRFFSAGDIGDGCEALASSLAGLFAHAAGRSEAGLAPGDVAALATGLGCPPELGGRVRGVLEGCDAARFGAGSAESANLATEARSVLDESVAALKRAGYLR